MATIGENVIVVDHDDDFVRAGYPIPERDPLLQPSLVRRSGGGDGELLRPVVNRRVVDWDQLESVYAHVFYRQLGWVEGDEGAALVTEPLFTSRADRERLAQMMFESFNVAGLYVAERPVAALYAVGKVSGVSVDVGYAVTDVAPVVEGAVVAPAAQRRFVGSKHLSRAVADACFAAADASSEPRWNAARDAVLAVASSRDEFDADPAATPATSYALPDGNVVEVSGATRAGIPEALLRGADVGASAPAAAGARAPPRRRRRILRIRLVLVLRRRFGRGPRGGPGVHAGAEARVPRRGGDERRVGRGRREEGGVRREGREGSGGRPPAERQAHGRARAGARARERGGERGVGRGGDPRQGGVPAEPTRVEDRVPGKRTRRGDPRARVRRGGGGKTRETAFATTSVGERPIRGVFSSACDARARAACRIYNMMLLLRANGFWMPSPRRGLVRRAPLSKPKKMNGGYFFSLAPKRVAEEPRSSWTVSLSAADRGV